MTRWRPVVSQAEAGNVSLLRGAWNAAWLDELTMAPVAAHDDQVDATSGAFLQLTHSQPTITIKKITGF